MRILVVDDDRAVRESLRRSLSFNGYSVSLAEDGVEALNAIASDRPDAVVLDVMMPGEDGVSLTRAIRETSNVPILLLTAKAETDDRIAGFEAGADDYLIKPFEPKELLLRINAILRRMPEPEVVRGTPKVLSLGRVRYDIERGELWQGDEPVRLTATESQLMRIFAAKPGEAISRAQLVEDLGRDRDQSQERAVDVQITRLRRKLEADPKQPRYLQTVRGAGYMLAPD